LLNLEKLFVDGQTDMETNFTRSTRMSQPKDYAFTQ